MVGEVEEVIKGEYQEHHVIYCNDDVIAGREPQPPASHMFYPMKLNLTFLVHKIINFHRIKIKIINTFLFPLFSERGSLGNCVCNMALVQQLFKYQVFVITLVC